jgi:cellulose synthase/poly-beta-1,6-N-acetylglucosamine synthase-like glycosyltransferase
MVWVALISLAVVAYTYAGYPVLVALLGRLFPLRSVANLTWEPMVSACVPFHGGAELVDAKIDSLLALDWPADKLELLFFSDGSTDGSDQRVLLRAAKDPRIRLVRSDERCGKPAALNALRAQARGEVLLMTDVRQPLDRSALRALVADLRDPKVGCVSGNLMLAGGEGAGMYWRYEKWIRRSEGRFRGLVGVTGALYVVRKDDVDELRPDLLLDDMWIPMRLRLQRRRILFCERAVVYDRAFGDEREFGRKVRTLAGNFQLLARMPRLLVPLVNPSWFETFSHKVMRLVCPFALVALLVASIAVAMQPPEAIVWAMRALAAAQIAGYATAALGSAAGRLGGLARTFVVLHAAAVVGLWRFLRGAQRVTW